MERIAELQQLLDENADKLGSGEYDKMSKMCAKIHENCEKQQYFKITYLEFNNDHKAQDDGKFCLYVVKPEIKTEIVKLEQMKMDRHSNDLAGLEFIKKRIGTKLVRDESGGDFYFLGGIEGDLVEIGRNECCNLKERSLDLTECDCCNDDNEDVNEVLLLVKYYKYILLNFEELL